VFFFVLAFDGELLGIILPVAFVICLLFWPLNDADQRLQGN